VLEASQDLLSWTEGPRLEFLDGSGTQLFVEDVSSDPAPNRFFRLRRER
jgi:hypothetical protein